MIYRPVRSILRSDVMPTFNGVLDYEMTRRNCDGSLVVVGTPTTTDVTTSIHPDGTTISRTTPPNKGSYDKNGFRPFTDHEASGRKIRAANVGQVQMVTNGTSCAGTNPLTYQKLYAKSSVYLSAVSLGPPTGLVSPEDHWSPLVAQAIAESVTGSFDVSTNLAELPKAIAMLANAKNKLASSFIDTLRAYLARHKKGGASGASELSKLFADLADSRTRMVRFRKLIDDMSSMWLELRYGWRPLLYSIMDLNEALQKIEDVKGKARVINTGKAFKSFEFERTVSLSQWNTSNGPLQTLAIQSSHQQSLRATCASQLRPGGVAWNANLLLTAYELIPLSFVFQWLVDVESFLKNVGSSPSTYAQSLCVSQEIKSTVAIVGNIENQEELGAHVVVPLVVVLEDFSYQRSVQAMPTVPPINLQFNVGGLKSLDLITLLIQRLPHI